ncbi:MAG: hypothetical protein HY962_16550 [Ignavibacteriae bacterium]|nr:hypothetical protein [Ignavibacteriota bacterium]
MSHVFRTLFLFLAAGTALFAQTGSWKTYTSMREVRDLAVTGRDIWAATAGGVFRYATSDGTFTSYTNVEGLASIDIRAVEIDANGRIIVGAATGALNILEPGGGWISVLDIARATDKPQRGINAIRTKEGRIYIATDFGVSVYNPVTREFTETWQKFGALPAQSSVKDIYFTGQSIWIATAEGIAHGDAGSANLQDPSSWTSYTAADGLPSKVVSTIVSYGGTIVVGTDKGCARLESGSWLPVYLDAGAVPVREIITREDTLFFITDEYMYRVEGSAVPQRIGPSSTDPRYGRNTVYTRLALMAGEAGPLLGSSKGVSRYSTAGWSFVQPDGPIANQISSLAVDDSGVVWSASPGSGVSGYNGVQWRQYSPSTNPPLPAEDPRVVAAGPDGSLLIGTWGSGVVRRNADGTLHRYDRNTHPEFPGIPDSPEFSPIGGLMTDTKGNIWMVHHRGANARILSCLTRDGRWYTYRNPYYDDAYVYGLGIDQFGTKWLWGGYNFLGVITFNENGTLESTGDDVWKKVDPNAYLADKVLVATTDRLGDVWIGTPLGPRTVYNPSTPERSSRTCYNTRCNLEGLVVNCLAIDPVNNKWLGTNAGVFVLSSDGSTIIEQYTVDNSPLIDNAVRSIVVHPATGDAYFGTNKGISRLSTPFVQAAATGKELRVSPNPFRPDIDGQARIDGLAEGSTMKILAPSGSVVREITTPGGRIGFWDGKDEDGEYVASGVYIIAAYQADGLETRLGKILVVRQ